MPEPMNTVGNWDTDLQITVVSFRFPGMEDRPLTLEFAGYDEAEAAYLDALRLDTDNPVLLRELYHIYLMRRDAPGLEKLRERIRDEVWKGAPTEDGKAWLTWTGAAPSTARSAWGR